MPTGSAMANVCVEHIRFFAGNEKYDSRPCGSSSKSLFCGPSKKLKGMKRLFLLACILAPSLLSAQTYFYINSITTDPINPTDQDNITLEVQGDLSNGGAFIVASSAIVNGTTIEVTIDADSQGGIGVLVPHVEFIPLGNLSPGTYTVQITGMNIQDNAPGAMHQFIVTGLGTGLEEQLDHTTLHATYGNGVLFLGKDGEGPIGRIVVFDSNGKQVHGSTIQGNSSSIALDGLKPGNYFLQSSSGTIRFVVAS